MAASKGAIPKRRSSQGNTKNDERRNSMTSRVDSPLHFADDDYCDEIDTNDDDSKMTHSDVSKNYWRHRKNFRRRPPTPPTNTTSTEGGTIDEANVDLRQRILDILSTSNNEDCERELSKLKIELDNRSRRSALVAVASSSASNETSNLSTNADDSRLSSRRRSSGGARRRRHRNNTSTDSNSTVGHRERRCRTHQRSTDQSKNTVTDLLGENLNFFNLNWSILFIEMKYLS
jgi:hypothetical protein